MAGCVLEVVIDPCGQFADGLIDEPQGVGDYENSDCAEDLQDGFELYG